MDGARIAERKTRFPVVADIFYPGSPDEMARQLEAHRKFALRFPPGEARAIVAPHAGWEYSGDLAAAAFRAAEGRAVSTLVIIGPIHRPREEGIFLSESERFETPIGDVAIDLDLCGELESCGTSFITNDIPHLEEHSIEVVLPFAQRYFPGASVVPILVGGANPALVRSLARGLDVTLRSISDRTLVVVSTNLCDHLGEEQARAHADGFLDLFTRRDSEGLLRAHAERSVSACGIAACAALAECELLDGTSCDVIARGDSKGHRPEGEREKGVVQYAALAIR